MRAIRLVSYIFMENFYWGVVCGGVMGAVYGIFILFLLYATRAHPSDTLIGIIVVTLIASPYGAAFGLVCGAGAGLILGSVNGISVGLIGLLIFLARGSLSVYRLSAGVLSIAIVFVAGVHFFSGLVSPIFPNSTFVTVIVPSIIAMLVIVYASQRAARWYLAASTTNG